MALANLTVSLEQIRTIERLSAIRSEWQTLWERCPEATPFQRPEWLLNWCSHFRSGDLLCLALHSNGRLAALAFFMQHANPGAPKSICFAGTGITDYLDTLIEPSFARTGA